MQASIRRCWTWGRNPAFEAVTERDPAFLQAFIARPENQWVHVLQYDIGPAVAAAYYPLLTSADAALHSFEGAYGLPLEVPPYRDLRLAEAPAEVAAWAEQHLETNFAGTLAAGAYTYLLATAAPGDSVALELKPTEKGSVQVHARSRGDRYGDRYRLLRFAAPVAVDVGE